MKIIMLGAGAIGSLYGAKLSKFNDVTLVGNRRHAEKIRKSGLKITGLESKKYPLNAVAKIKKIEEDTLILLATKVHDSEKAIKGIKNLLREDTIILCLQNGLYSENVVKKVIRGKCAVLRAITNFGAIFLEPGIVRYTAYSYTAIEKSPASREIAENFRKCGLNGCVSKNIRYDMWKKVIFNCVVNPVTAILKIKNRGISDKKLNPLKSCIIEECLNVAKKDGISFSFDFMKALDNEFRNSENVSSMQQDLLKGRKTEIDYLNGAVARLGKKHRIECPVNESLASMIKFLESRQGQNL